jgi:hypothetical protein
MLQSKTKKPRFFISFIFFLLFLLTFNFLNLANYILLFIGLLFLIVILLYKPSIRFDLVDLFFLLFCFSYIFFYRFYLVPRIGEYFYFLIGLPIIYFTGKVLISSTSDFVYLVILVTLGFLVRGVFNFIFTLYFFDYSDVFGSRTMIDFWTKTPLSSTLEATYYIFVCSILFYNLYLLRFRKFTIINLILILGTIFAFFVNFLLSNRSIFFITGIIFLSNFFGTFFSKKINFLRYLILLSLIIIVPFFVYSFNPWGVKTIFEESIFYERIINLNLFDDNRIDYFFLGFNNLFQYPWGGFNIISNGYLHNLYFDVLNATGIFPFLFLLLFSIKIYFDLFLILKNKKVLKSVKILLFSIFGSLFLVFNLEPVLYGVPYLFSIFALFSAVLRTISTKDIYEITLAY